MTPEMLNKIIRVVELHKRSAAQNADYWELQDTPDARRFRSTALAEYVAYDHMLSWLKDEKAVDYSLEIWDN